MPYKIQKKRSLIERLAALEKQVQEHSQKESQKEQQEAEAPIINPGMIGGRLMITQGNGYPPQAPPVGLNGTGIPPLGVPPMMTGFGGF